MRSGNLVRLALMSAVIGLGGAPTPTPGEVPALEEETPFPPVPEHFSLEDADPETGREIFVRSCASCHGEDGSGDGRIETDPPARDLRDPERMDRLSDWQILSVIRDGGKPYGLSERMIPWGSMLDDDELRDVAAFVRSLSSRPAEDSGPPGDSEPVEKPETVEGSEPGEEPEPDSTGPQPDASRSAARVVSGSR